MSFKYYVFKVFLFMKKCFKLFTYYTFKFNLCILEFFTRKIPYLFYLFAFTFGTFGNIEDLPTILVILKVICFMLSWYLIDTSFIIFIVFKIPTSKNYLYKLLGKEFVVEKIGNPGWKPLIRYIGPATAILTGNEIGRHFDGKRLQEQAEIFHTNSAKSVRENPHYTSQQKAEESLKNDSKYR